MSSKCDSASVEYTPLHATKGDSAIIGKDRHGFVSQANLPHSFLYIPPTLRKRIHDWWLIELGAWIISAVAMGALSIVLIRYDGKPLLEWPWSINLNSFISILSAVAKATVLVPTVSAISQLKWHWFLQPRSVGDIQTFDDASRGPSGAIALLFSQKAMHFASFGALIMLAAATIDPFVQQVVTYPGRLSASTAASVPTSQAFNDAEETPVGSFPAFEWRSAFLTGLYEPETDGRRFAVTPSCPTSNCTWPEYRSLAVCSSCVDVTATISKQGCGKDLVGPWCNFTLQSGLILPYVRLGQNLHRMDHKSAWMVANSANAASQFSPLQWSASTITAVEIMNTTLDSHNSTTLQPVGVTATACMLNACVRSLNASVRQNEFTETIQQVWTEPTKANFVLSGEEDPGAIFEVGRETYHYISVTSSRFAQYLQETMAGFVWSEHTGETTNDNLKSLYKFGNITQTMDNIAASMTRFMRESKSPNNNVTMVQGTAWETVVHIHVCWWWLALPLTLEVGSLAFLLITIAKCQQSKVMAWKTSSLAILRSGATMGAGLTEARTLYEMQEAADKTLVKLRVVGSDVQLIECNIPLD